MPLEIRHFTLMLLGGSESGKRTQIPAFAALGTDLARIQAIFAGFQLADRVCLRKFRLVMT